MIWQDWVILVSLAVISYLAIGIIVTLFVIDQTPYSPNPTWIKILLWWLYLAALVFG